MEQLIALLSEIKPEIDFQKEKNMIDDGLLDSIEIVMIISEIEEKYGISISPDDIDPDNFQSTESMYNMISKIIG